MKNKVLIAMLIGSLSILLVMLIGSLFILSLTGCTFNSNTQESTTEALSTEQTKVDISTTGYDSSDDALNAFSKIFSTNMTKEDLDKCIYSDVTNRDELIDNMLNTVNTIKSTVTFNSKSIKYFSIDMDAKSLYASGYENASEVKTNRITILGETSNETSDTNSIYSFDIYTVCMNNRWFVTGLTVLNDTTVLNQNVKVDLTTVDGTIENPAKLNQWIKTTIKEPESNQDVEVLVKITKVLSGDKAKKAIKEHNKDYNTKFTELGNDLEYCAFKYQVYCANPSIFKSAPIISFSNHTSNENEDINKQLLTTWDLSNTNIDNFNKNYIWKTGFTVFTRIKDNKDYLIKINPQSENTEPSYISLIKASEDTK